jgi:transcription initiation factor TFIIE subunit alpha
LENAVHNLDKRVAMLSNLDDATLVRVATALGEEDAVKLIEILKNAEEITDDEIANKTSIRLNSVRKILYKLYDHSLVSLRRTRDPKTGWFIFHWKLQPDQLEGFIVSQKRRVLEKLNTRLEFEKNHDFFFCYTAGCKRVPFEDAVELVFRCSTCSKPLMHYDNDKILHALTKKIDTLRKELGE